MSTTPLAGIRVVDFTTFLSGPFGTQLLADLGAEVIKVEPPDGDSSRTVPPHFIGADSAYFLGNNRNKRSVVVNLREEDGQAVARSLVATADVVMENHRPGVARRLGLDSAQLCQEHPSLVWASISGFGQEGPRSGLAAYDMIVQALSGVMSLTGEPERPAVRLGIPAGDLVAGLYAVIGVLAALNKRSETGFGSIIDISMLDCQLAMTSYQAVYSMHAGTTPQPQGARHDSIPTYRSFVGSDGRELVVTANTERMWMELCGIVGRRDLLLDPRYGSAAARLENRESLWLALEDAMAQRPADEWVALLESRGVPAALIKTLPEALTDAVEDQREMVLILEDDKGAQVSVIGNPVKFLDATTAVQEPSYPPALGADTADVLLGLGFSRAQIESLINQGVVFAGGEHHVD